MFTTRRLPRSAQLSAVACALVLPATAAAQSHPQERYLASQGTGESSLPAPEERYYGSYGNPESLPLPESPATSGDGFPWLPVALSVGGGLVIAGAGAGQARRGRIRRRQTAQIPA